MLTQYSRPQINDGQPLGVGELLEKLRPRPELYLGIRSLTALWYFLHGYHMALPGRAEASKMWRLPQDFHDWVAYRLNFLESTSGWKSMILHHVPDEAAALDRFFLLLDEYSNRRQHLVARLDGLSLQYKEIQGETESIHSFPSSLLLVKYTDDRGFWVYSETGEPFPGGRFTPFLGWFERFFKVSRNQLTILDPVTYHRWLDEDNRPAK